jgi:hypothetical protein
MPSRGDRSTVIHHCQMMHTRIRAGEDFTGTSIARIACTMRHGHVEQARGIHWNSNCKMYVIAEGKR